MHFLFWVAAAVVSAWEPAVHALSAESVPPLLPTLFLVALALLAVRADGTRHRTLALAGIAGTLSVPALSVLAYEYGRPMLFEGASGPVATAACVVLVAAADLVKRRRPAPPYLLPTTAVAVPFLVAEADLRFGGLAWFSLPDWLAIELLFGSGVLSALVLLAVATRRLWVRAVTVGALAVGAVAGVSAALLPLSYGYEARQAAIAEKRVVVKESGEGVIPSGEIWQYPAEGGGVVIADVRTESELPPLEHIEAEGRMSPFWYTGAYLAAAAIVMLGRARPAPGVEAAEPVTDVTRPAGS
ncbi:hypothetical protein [Nonomuraea sp. bgisy101]|uniref:hypothetical protein n=1 Tax=Nonomuraea sp. bgisy101 TaxID=3413784 RepID=UPI003D706F46